MYAQGSNRACKIMKITNERPSIRENVRRAKAFPATQTVRRRVALLHRRNHFIYRSRERVGREFERAPRVLAVRCSKRGRPWRSGSPRCNNKARNPIEHRSLDRILAPLFLAVSFVDPRCHLTLRHSAVSQLSRFARRKANPQRRVSATGAA